MFLVRNDVIREYRRILTTTPQLEVARTAAYLKASELRGTLR